MIPTYRLGQIGTFRRPSAGGGGGGYNAETVAWAAGIVAAGGTVTTQEKDWADALILAIQAATFNAKLIWLNPFLGSNIKAARMPLRDTNARGIMNSYGSSPFVDADCGNAKGIENPTEKNAFLGTNLQLNLIKSGSILGGFGFYERNWGNGANVEPMGVYDTAGGSRFLLDLRSSFQRFRWGGVTGHEAGPATTTSSGHYYGQDNGSYTEIWKNGADLGSHGASGGGDGSVANEIFVMGINAPTDAPWKGRCGCAYITDGTLTGAEITALHTLLGTYLITPTGR